MSIKSLLEKVTPEYASELLGKNENNRPLSQSHVRYLADQMERGQWKTTHQGIAISIDGEILDGQHRLHAIIKSGVTIEMPIIRGLDKHVFDVIDTGKIRSSKDVLKVAGFKNYKNTAAIIGGILQYEKNFYTSGKTRAIAKVTNTDILNFAYSNPHIAELSKNAFAWSRGSGNILSTKIIGTLYWFFSKNSNDKANEFFNILCRGDNIGEYPGLQYLRRRFAKDKVSIAKMTGRTKSALICKAWNKFQAGDEFKILGFGADESFPEIL